MRCLRIAAVVAAIVPLGLAAPADSASLQEHRKHEGQTQQDEHVSFGGPTGAPAMLPGAPEPQADSAAVAATVDRFHRALETGDSAAALSLLAPDVVILEGGGTETLGQYRRHHLAADMAFAKAVKSLRKRGRVTVAGDVAWAWATSATDGEYRGRRIAVDAAELAVLSRRGSGWVIRAMHWSSESRRGA
jgi:ketosteroid isomerase-like protein